LLWFPTINSRRARQRTTPSTREIADLQQRLV
jgi:hypothetical protein